MLNKNKMEYYRELLNRRLETLQSNGGRALNDMAENDGKLPDPTDRATLESDRSFALRIKEREQKLIMKIKEALERIDNGTYGICEECEEEITEGRLEARPVTTLCIECKRRQETEERVRGI